MVRTSRASGIHATADLFQAGDIAHLGPPARELAEAGCTAIVWACTSGSFIGGLDWARAQAAELKRITGRPATSTSLAILAAAEHIGAERIDLLGTYPEDVTLVLKKLLEDGGLVVQTCVALNAPTGKDTFALDLRAAARRLAGPSFGRNPVVIPDTAANSLDLLEDLEAILDRPVLTAVQVSLWHGLVLMGVKPVARNAGLLFSGNHWTGASD
jgi:maleate isomerase